MRHLCRTMFLLNFEFFIVNSNEFKRWLAKQGCTFKTHKGGSGHLTVTNPVNGNISQLPMHGKKELGKGLMQAIKKQLGLKGV